MEDRKNNIIKYSIDDKDESLHITKYFENCNINFLIGSGFSCGIAKPLEKDLEENLEKYINENQDKNRNELLEIFFKNSIEPAIKCFEESLEESINENQNGVIKKQSDFIKTINDLIYNRMSYTIDKQVNIFTTNYDMCLEYACEKNHVDYIDGFLGKLEPEFDTQLFGQRIYNTSMLSNKETEKTLINIIKLHGSLSWKTKVKDDKIYYRNILSQDEKNFLTSDSLIDQYEDKENIFNIVLPSKRKFNQTLL